MKRFLDKRVAVFEEATEGEEGKNMVISLLQLVNVVIMVTLYC